MQEQAVEVGEAPAEFVPADGGGVVADLPGGRVRLASPAGRAGRVILGIRPEDLSPCDPTDAGFTGMLAVVDKLGSQSFGYLAAQAGLTVTIALERDTRLAPGDRVAAKGTRAAVHVFDPATERRRD